MADERETDDESNGWLYFGISRSDAVYGGGCG